MGSLSIQSTANLGCQVVVNNVLEINLVKIVCPRVQDREAFMLNSLSAVLFNIFSHKFEASLVSGDGVAQIIIIDLFVGVTDKRTDSLDT